ncbi:hypothetical protein K443DRAFT_676313 [Laccaria amethystina LaAM-08-1]|uniref:Transmembrane protein n=1 Tax=Laccaria amethystina LaAM-08-1 TaxID=1095629 RepID=A0A0C9XQT7_9AGAR|nr:hypothetical protein K443DRAFT_676313 [Laccaria amethystina LaAM-08-1]
MDLQPLRYSQPQMKSPQLFTEDKASNTQNPVADAQMEARRKTVTGRAILFGGLVILTVVGMILVLLSYLCVAHQCSRGSSRTLISTAPLGKVLTISQVTSHVAPVAIPLVMGLWSLHLGATWLKSSAMRGVDRPSPMQFGLLLSICTGAGLPALAAALKYMLNLNKGGSPSLPIPPMLRRTTVLLFIFLVLSYLISASDAWFHASSRAISIASTSPYLFPATFGRVINATMCDPATYNSGTVSQLTCGLLSGGSGGNARTRMEGLRAVSNSSALHRAVFTDDQTAILVPQTIPANVSYTARTIGVKSTCQTITSQCLAPSASLGYGPNAALLLKCTGSAVFNATGSQALYALDDQGNTISGYKVPSNPFHAGEVVISQAYYQAVEDQFVPNSGWFIHGSNGAWNVVFCDVTALDVQYVYSSSRFIVRESTPLSADSARHVMTLGIEGGSVMVSQQVDGAGLQTNMTYEQAYGLELSRQAIARGAFVYESTGVSTIQRELETIGTSINLVPLALLLGGMLVFCLFVLFVVVQILLSAARVPYVRLAALQLNDPLTTVHALYGPVDPASTWTDQTFKKFNAETEGDRLSVGPIPVGEYYSQFGVTKGLEG